jgi:hypothetical protein
MDIGGQTEGVNLRDRKNTRHYRAVDTVICDGHSAHAEHLARIDYSTMIALAEELGMLEVHRDLNSFAGEGLVK